MWPHDYDADAGHEPCDWCGLHSCEDSEACVTAHDAHMREVGASKERKAHVHWLYVAAKAALAIARTYRVEEGKQGRRERETLAQVRSYRADIRAIRAGGSVAQAAE